ncbi:MAG: lysophospholipid acyltransferase family protein [Vicinamibacterales bacterium]
MGIPPFDWWRTVFFLIPSIAVYTIVLGTLSVASSLYDSRGRFAHGCARLWSWLILATTGVAVHVYGLGRLDPGRTYVFVSNHQSIYDIPIVFSTLPYQVRIIAKQSLARFPFLGWHLSRTGHMLVDRSRPDRARIFRRWSDLVSEGLSLIVFPEGTRSMDGTVGRFKAGSVLLAMQVGLPIVPISIVNSRCVMRKGRMMTRPGHVDLVIHDVIETSGNRETTVEEARELCARIRETVASSVARRANLYADHV